MDKNLHIAIKAAIEAGKEIMKIKKKMIFYGFKSDNSPLTIADIESKRTHKPFVIMFQFYQGRQTPFARKEVFGGTLDC